LYLVTLSVLEVPSSAGQFFAIHVSAAPFAASNEVYPVPVLVPEPTRQNAVQL
jgi:hypothetical protein